MSKQITTTVLKQVASEMGISPIEAFEQLQAKGYELVDYQEPTTPKGTLNSTAGQKSAWEVAKQATNERLANDPWLKAMSQTAAMEADRKAKWKEMNSSKAVKVTEEGSINIDNKKGSVLGSAKDEIALMAAIRAKYNQQGE
ncbi:hypothetical protein [Pseudomonas sp. Marseille-Q7302]